MEIRIIGNGQSYYLNRKIKETQAFLRGDLSSLGTKPIEFIFEDKKHLFKDRKDLYSFSDEIRGKEKSEIIHLVSKYQFNDDFIKKIEELNVVKSSLFKSLFLIEYWIDLTLSLYPSSDFKLEELIYDNFIIDFNYKEGPQRDIYFLKKKLQEKEEIVFDKFYELNLLIKLEITVPVKKYISYTTSLLNPGIPKDMFYIKDRVDINAYKIWKEIIADKKSRARTWFEENRD